MKVDIEGAEYDVFMSSAEVLRKGLFRNIALEIHPSILKRRGLSPERLHDQFLSCGYILTTLDGHCVYTFTNTTPSADDGVRARI